MDTKEEMIEEIEEMEDLSTDSKENVETRTEEVKPDVSVVEPVIEDATLEPVLNDNVNTTDEQLADKKQDKKEEIAPEQKEEIPQEEQVKETPKKNKAPLIVLLSILLVLDIAALVIYIIGIEKVISFIK